MPRSDPAQVDLRNTARSCRASARVISIMSCLLSSWSRAPSGTPWVGPARRAIPGAAAARRPMAWFAGVPGPATRRPGVAGGRLQARQPASEVVAHIEARGQKPKNAKITAEDTPAGLGALGKMKGRYAQVLA